MLRIYGKPKELQEKYYEVPYKEYRADGSILQLGTEDFSSQRLKTLKKKYVWTWNGEKRNKGGHRWFECQELVTFNGSTKELKTVLGIKYPDAKLIELR
jgi:hypothetical protein